MTQLALLKRKINFASNKQISHVIICTYTDKGKERLEFSLTRIPPAPPNTPKPLKIQTLFGWGAAAPAPGSLTRPHAQAPLPALTLPGRECEPQYRLDFP